MTDLPSHPRAYQFHPHLYQNYTFMESFIHRSVTVPSIEVDRTDDIQVIDWSIGAWIHRSIDPSIHRSKQTTAAMQRRVSARQRVGAREKARERGSEEERDGKRRQQYMTDEQATQGSSLHGLSELRFLKVGILCLPCLNDSMMSSV